MKYFQIYSFKKEPKLSIIDFHPANKAESQLPQPYEGNGSIKYYLFKNQSIKEIKKLLFSEKESYNLHKFNKT